ncbi:GumC family protein [Terracidiphilus sp.]|jgi:polysaccharide chain length determinant protein (PEP-CTERM system associated)|uniref:GumC family protein n=1 Tax=Terracidiphilus sp. TaxID=1964191 RepID=UPI003C23CC56
MPEEFEETSSQPFDIGRYLDIIRRRHLIFLTLLLVGWAGVWGSSWLLPAKYKSSTQILVEEPEIPKNYVVSNISDNQQDRLQSITQQILSRTRLLTIIDKLHLYQSKRHVLTPDERVDRMRKDIGIDLIKDEKTNTITAFKISYVAPDAHTAQLVTSELTSLFIDENSKVLKQESQNTTQFIETQLATARANLAEQEARVREFQSAHEGALPSQQTANLQILSGLQSQLQNEQDALNAAKQQGVYHQSLIEQYHAFDSRHSTAGGAPTGLAGIDDQLDKLRLKLQDLSTRYTDQYPEVQQVKAQIADAEKQRLQIIANLKKGADGKQPNSAVQVQEIQDPAQNAPLLQLQSQLQADQTEMVNRQRAISSLESRINQYQGLLNSEPAVSQQLAELTRGYEQSQTNYNDLLKKESDSQMATSMEQMQEGERFMTLDPPSLPLRPDFPNRLKMCGAGLGVGLVLGLLVVVLQEFMDDCMYSDREIIKLISVGVIAEIPQILNPSDTEHERRRMLLGWAMAALVLCVILSGSAFSYLHS